MNFSKERIEASIKIAEEGENKRDNWNEDPVGNRSLLLRMIEGKVLVDRWYNITMMFVFNSGNENLVINCIREKHKDTDGRSVWGAKIEFTEFVPLDKILVVGVPIDKNFNIEKPDILELSRCLALIPMPKEVKASTQD